MRRISFSLTTQQVRLGQKTVTRRLGWKTLRPGTQLLAVNKCMGLRKGEVAEKLAVIEVTSVRPEPLNLITKKDVIAEGFPKLRVKQFVEMFCQKMRVEPTQVVNRIEFRYVAMFHREPIQVGDVVLAAPRRPKERTKHGTTRFWWWTSRVIEVVTAKEKTYLRVAGSSQGVHDSYWIPAEQAVKVTTEE